MYITDFMPKYRKLKESLDNYNLVLVHGKISTGKTGFVNNYYNNFEGYNIIRADSFTPIKVFRSMMKTRECFFDKRIIIYDDIKIKKEILTIAEKYINPIRGNVVFVAIVNEFKSKLTKFVIHKVKYPTKNILSIYLNKIELKDLKLKVNLLKLEPKSLRRIEMAIEDGYLINTIEKPKKFRLYDSNTFVLSFAIAENQTRLNRFDESLCQIDKFKKNERLYKDFIKLFYPSLDRMRLRYPKELLNLIKIKKG